MEKVYLISLGCPKNRVDSEVLLGTLAAQGFMIVSELEEADVAVLNTCAFIRSAVEESVETILELADYKEKGHVRSLVVIGCVPQRYGAAIVQEIPEVDFWAGTGDFLAVVRWLREGEPRAVIGPPRYLYNHRTPRILANTRHSAYVKIAEGCSHGCTFCLIPRLRGRYRSRLEESVVAEVQQLAAMGVVEVNLIAQDSTAYGSDLKERPRLEEMLRRLGAVEGIQWIRVLYAFPRPDAITSEFLKIVANHEKICPYLDMPVQHVNNGILRRMGRKNTGADVRELVLKIRKEYPHLALRTTVMVGFPGEGDAEFDELLQFVKEAEFTHLGVFAYSPEEGTRAYRMKKRPRHEIAYERAERLMLLQQEISLERNRKLLGTVIPVLIEGGGEDGPDVFRARAPFQAPDIDGLVYVRAKAVQPGDIIPALVTGAQPYDLVGEVVDQF